MTSLQIQYKVLLNSLIFNYFLILVNFLVFESLVRLENFFLALLCLISPQVHLGKA